MLHNRNRKGRYAFLYRTSVPKFGVASDSNVANTRIVMEEEIVKGQSIEGFSLRPSTIDIANSNVRMEFSMR